MWSSNCIPIVSLSLEAVGVRSWLNVSGYWCPTLWISLVRVLVFGFPFMCLPLWPMVSGSARASLL